MIGKLLKGRGFVFCMFVGLLLLLVLSISTAQENLIDVVYLKNGSIIRGIIIEQVPNKSIKIQTRDGSVFFYEIESIDKITKEPSVAPRMAGPSGPPLSDRAYLFNPLGFLQFGPIAEVELKIAPNKYLTPHLRYSALGLLYRALESEGFEDKVSMASMALGVGIRQFSERPGSANRLYYGATLEYGWGRTQSGYGDWQGKDAQIILMSNFGYRWRYQSGRLMNLGLLAGFAYNFQDEYDGSQSAEAGAVIIFGMLELSFGWQK